MTCDKLHDPVPGRSDYAAAGAGTPPVPGTGIGTGLPPGTGTGSGTGPELGTRIGLGTRPPTRHERATLLAGHWYGLILAGARRRWRREHGLARTVLTAQQESFWSHVQYVARRRWVPAGYRGWLIPAGIAYHVLLALPVDAAASTIKALIRRPITGIPALAFAGLVYVLVRIGYW